MLGLLVSSELVVQLLSDAWARLSKELEEGEVQLGAFGGDTGHRKQTGTSEICRAITQKQMITAIPKVHYRTLLRLCKYKFQQPQQHGYFLTTHSNLSSAWHCYLPLCALHSTLLAAAGFPVVQAL